MSDYEIIKQLMKPLMSRIYKGLISETFIPVNKINIYNVETLAPQIIPTYYQQILDDIKERIQMFSNLAYQMYTKIDIRNYRYILSNYLNDETREFLKKVIAIAKDNDILNDEMEVDISRAKLIIYVKLKLK